MTASVLLLLTTGMIIALAAFLGVMVVRRWAEKQLLDIPNERSSHVRPTPRGGGIVIALITIVGLIGFTVVSTDGPTVSTLVIIASAILVAAISWLDDLQTVPNRVRFAVHIVIAALIVMFVGSWDFVTLPLVGEIELGWIGAVFTIVWIVGLINAYNFMDGIDGIAGGQAVVAAVGWVLLGAFIHSPLIVWTALLVGASALGFLFHNWSPARIFMGDVGSAFLGFSFAVVTVVANKENSYMAVAGILLIWPFLFDTIFTITRRILNGDNVFTAHRSHLYQRLVISGYSHQFVALLYIFLSCVGLVTALAWVHNVAYSGWAVIFVPAGLSIGLWAFVNRQERVQTRQTSVS
jgi:Fuc2NAc and GlcNAc transferase